MRRISLFMVRVRKTIRRAVRDTLKVLLPLAYRLFYWARPHRYHAEPRNPKRILILNGAHIGDIVISTSLLPVLRSAYPKAQIGFLAGSWAKMVVEKHPYVDLVHYVDHWWHNRDHRSFLAKLLHFYRTRSMALHDIRKARYDMAVCIYPFLSAILWNWHGAPAFPCAWGSVAVFCPG